MVVNWALRLKNVKEFAADVRGYSPPQAFSHMTGVVGTGQTAGPLRDWISRAANLGTPINLLLVPEGNFKGTGLNGEIEVTFATGTTPTAIENYLVGCIAGIMGIYTPAAVPA